VGNFKPVLPSYAPAAAGDGALVYTLADHKLLLSFSSDKAYSCCPEENMSVLSGCGFQRSLGGWGTHFI